MYIRRKVFSVYLDEETGEERLFSTTEFIDEERYFSEEEIAQPNRLRRRDALSIGVSKKLSSKKHRDAFIDAYENGNSEEYSKLVARPQAIGDGIGVGASLGALSGVIAHKKGLSNPKSIATGVATGLASGVATGLGSNMLTKRSVSKGVERNRKIREDKPGGRVDRNTLKNIDQLKVANGEMSEADYIAKHGGR